MFRNCLNRQITELESLQAMYCGPNELTIWNEAELENLKSTVQGRTRLREDDLPQVAFQLQLPLDPPFSADLSLVFRVSLPPFYPASDSAEVHISLDTLTPQEEKDLREATGKFVETKIGQECILDLVQYAKEWIYDNVTPSTPSAKKASIPLIVAPLSSSPPSVVVAPASKSAAIPVIVAPTTTTTTTTAPVERVTPVSTILTLPPRPASVSTVPSKPAPVAAAPSKPAPAQARKAKAAPKGKNTPQAPKEQEFRRIMIWFTTIAPDRAKTIAEWAKQLGLTGMSRLGTPAFVVVEGQKEDVDEYISSLRTFRWKKMEIVWEDKMQATNTNACRRFTNFQEYMMSLQELQTVFKKVGLEDMCKEGMKIRG